MADEVVPGPLTLPSHAFDVAFHPDGAETNHLVAFAHVTGQVTLWKVDANTSTYVEAGSFKIHESSCREVAFFEAGAYKGRLATGSADCHCAVADVNGQIYWTSSTDVHEDAVNAVKIIGETLIATGDDEGVIKVWDIRTPGSRAVVSFEAHDESVSSISHDAVYHPQEIVATIGGKLCVLDLRKKSVLESEDGELDLLCSAIVKSGEKILCGASSKGSLLVYDWGDAVNPLAVSSLENQNQCWTKPIFARPDGATDIIPVGHFDEITTLECVSTDDFSVVLTGSSDGLVRVVGAYPSKVYGIVGSIHEDVHDEADRIMDVALLGLNSTHTFIDSSVRAAAGNGADPVSFLSTKMIPAMIEQHSDAPVLKSKPSSAAPATEKFFEDM